MVRTRAFNLEGLLPTVLFAVVKLPKNQPPILKKKIRDQFRWRIRFAGKIKVFDNLPFESGLFFNILASRSTSMYNIFTFGSGSVPRPSYTQCPAVWIH